MVSRFKKLKTTRMDVKTETVKQLPFQDTMWVISMVTDTESDGTENRMVVIMDAQRRMLATSHADDNLVSFTDQAYNLLCDCALRPMIGQPRKPKYIKVQPNMNCLEVDSLGIQRIYGQMPCHCCSPGPPMKTCCFCQFRGSPQLFIKCCGVVYYCSHRCLVSDASDDRGRHSHSVWCRRMREYTATADDLANFPFTFTSECTSSSFDKAKLMEFLRHNGVFGLGFWRRECLSICQKDAPPFGELSEEMDPYVLPLEGMILEDATPPSDMTLDLSDWREYYAWRGFSLDSPICILLQFPLTLYHILKTRIPIDYPSADFMRNEDHVIIHIVGIEKEADMAPVFREIGILFPHSQFEIHFFGPHISRKVHNKIVHLKNVEIKMHRQLYHKNKQKPHLVVGYNAGIGAYMSWTETLIRLKNDRTPAYFTDYCQYSCECAKAPMTDLGLGTTSAPCVNPFRSPLRLSCEEHDMPWYSNAFLFYLIYAE